MRYYFSSTKQKVMLLLLAGVVISLNRSPKVQWRVLKTLPKAFRFIDRTVLIRTLKEFYRDRLVDWRQEKDGTVKIVLTDLGRKRALRYKIDELFIQMPLRWDKKWRIVMFDIPEKKKIAREAFRNKLQELGFVQFQKSAWVFPYPCKDIIDFIVEVFEIRSYVQYTEAVYITNDAKLRIHFDLK